jgi:hypothetical protein
MTTQTAQQPATLNQLVPFLTTPIAFSAGNNITQPSTTQFQLLPGYTYKLTAALNYTSNETTCQWYDSTNNKKLGVAGDSGNNPAPQHGTAVAYVTTATIINVGLMITSNNNGTITASTTDGRCSWAIIEMIGSGASVPLVAENSSNYSSLGLVPATNQQNYYRSGSGGWNKLGLGITGETWHDLTGQSTTRKCNTDYINTYSYPIMVSINVTTNNSIGANAGLVVDGVSVFGVQATTNNSVVTSLTTIVPAGKTYKYVSTWYNQWCELY